MFVGQRENLTLDIALGFDPGGKKPPGKQHRTQWAGYAWLCGSQVMQAFSVGYTLMVFECALSYENCVPFPGTYLSATFS